MKDKLQKEREDNINGRKRCQSHRKKVNCNPNFRQQTNSNIERNNIANDVYQNRNSCLPNQNVLFNNNIMSYDNNYNKKANNDINEIIKHKRSNQYFLNKDTFNYYKNFNSENKKKQKKKIGNNFIDELKNINKQPIGYTIGGGLQPDQLSNLIPISKISEFKIIQILRKGKNYIIEKAQKNNCFYVIKEIEINKNDKDQEIDLKREIEFISRFSHENIVKICDNFEENNKKYIIYEYIDGKNLEEFILDNNGIPLNQKTVLFIAKKIIKGLEFLHASGIMHRNLKPNNILLAIENNEIINIKIADFKNMILFKKDKSICYNDFEIYFSDTKIGNSIFTAPEISLSGNNKGSFDASSDIYSFGIILSQLMIKTTSQKNLYGDNELIPIKPLNKNYFDHNLYCNELIDLIFKMINDDTKKRPSGEQIYNEIEKMIEIDDEKNKSNYYISSINCIIHIFYNILTIRSYILSDLLSSNSTKDINVNDIFLAKNIRELFKYLRKVEKNEISKIYFYSTIIKDFKERLSGKLFSFDNFKEVPLNILINATFDRFMDELEKVDKNKSSNVIFNNVLVNLNQINFIPKNNFNEFYTVLVDFINKYRNIFVDLFYFIELNNIYECPFCHYKMKCETKIKRFLTFLINSEDRNIKQLLSKYFKFSYDFKNMSKCNNCNNALIIHNKMLNLPMILTIYLENARPGQLEIEEELLDLDKYKITDVGPKKYNLFAVISKIIKNEEEFYIAFIKNKNNWKLVNGGQIIDCNYKNIIQETPIMIFYKAA